MAAAGVPATAPDENFEEFVSNWTLFGNRLVVFLGAGASIGAKNRSGRPLPSAYELRNELWSKLKANDPKFDPTELRLMSLEHAAAIIEAKTGRTVLAEHLIELFRCDRPLWQHAALPYLQPKCIFTTNYDELIELGYKQHTGQLDVVCNDRQPVSGQAALYKPHGSLSHANQPIGQGGLVITQFDYLEMIAEYRKMLRRSMTNFGGTCVLIVGYSFSDMDIGAELYKIRKDDAGIPWYAVFPRDDASVRKMYSKRFGVEQINRTFEQFLAELDDRIGFLPHKLKHHQIDTLRRAKIIQ
jgi:hypothetical protein